MSERMRNGLPEDDNPILPPSGSVFFDPPILDDEDEDFPAPEEIDAAQMLNGMIEGVVQRGGNAVRRWCFERNIPPSDLIEEALGFLLAGILGASPDPSQLEMDDDLAEQTLAETRSMIADLAPDMQADLAIAMRQVQQFMQQFDSPEKMIEALGLPEDPAEDEA